MSRPHSPQASTTPSLTRRLGHAIKVLRHMLFTPWGGGAGSGGGRGDGWDWAGGLLGLDGLGEFGLDRRNDLDFARHMGDPWRNVAVAACLRVIRDNAPQPRMEVTEEDADGDRHPIPGAPLPALFRRPNGWYDYYHLMGSWTASAILDGNGYLIKVRSGARVPVELWWVPPWTMVPRWPSDDPTIYLDHWDYHPGGGSVYRLDPADVIHLRYGDPDPRCDRLAISPLKAAAARTICSLNEADGFTATLMAHGGIPPIMLRPLPGALSPTQEDAEHMTRDYLSLLHGNREGRPFIPLGPFEAVPMGYNPEQLALDRIPARLEDQICALMGVPAMLVGLTSGAQHKTYNNIQECRQSFYEETLIPMQARQASCLQDQLLGDPGMGDPDTQQVQFSYKGIQCLQEDQDKVAKRAVSLYQGGVYTRGQALRAMGEDATDDDEVYVVVKGQQFLRVGEEVPPYQSSPPPTSGPVPPAAPGAGVAPPPVPSPAPSKDFGGRLAGYGWNGDGKHGDPSPVAVTAGPGVATAIAPTTVVAVEAKADDPDLAGARDLLGEAARGVGLASLVDPTPEQRRTLLHALVDLAEARMRADAEALAADLSGESKGLIGDAAAKVKAWKDGAAKFLRRAFLAGALALTDPMTPDDAGAFEEAFRAQVAFLDDFGRAILAEDQGVGGIANRASLYGSAAWTLAETVAHRHAVDAGMKECMRVLDGGDHCDVCPIEAARGWIPVADLLPVGAAPCLMNCRCSVAYR